MLRVLSLTTLVATASTLNVGLRGTTFGNVRVGTPQAAASSSAVKSWYDQGLRLDTEGVEGVVMPTLTADVLGVVMPTAVSSESGNVAATLRLATLKREGAATVAARAASVAALKVATLKREGAATVAARAASLKALKVATLKREGAVVVAARAGVTAAVAAAAAAAAEKQAMGSAPDGFEWGGTF